MTLLEAVGFTLIIVSTVLSGAWMLRYHLATGGAWRDLEMGRHAMTWAAVITAILGLSTLRILVVELGGLHDPVWFQVIRVAVFTGIPALLIQRHRLLSKAQREEIP